ncbi:class I SAM-dependent methyltransferase [Chlamydia sp.]|uniref:class I SAM-dependent methyltransferase n=1 Tax=Chlamydia sp. TaxID=35827 RepID=UPI0025C4AADE|nr:class I SAM-dependent methyltransferase [Chlamydia sp.]MBQ8498523.1 methyltransferase domain-containing protein [Chlamydia sp.]
MLKKIDVFFSNVIKLSHALFQQVVEPGDVVVDATCGNGKDALFLAQLLKGEGRLVVYDIQQEALDRAKNNFEQGLSPKERSVIEMKLCSHEHIQEQGAKIFHYNLGYLPSGDKRITTCKTSTMTSIQKALELVSPLGVVSVVCYPGHEEGAEELVCIKQLATNLDVKDWEVCIHYSVNRKNAPQILLFRRRQG